MAGFITTIKITHSRHVYPAADGLCDYGGVTQHFCAELT